MASILRQIVASPRARHPEAGLDLCYVADNIVVTSGPSSVWPKKAYRNPTDQLVGFLDKKHTDQWSIFEFRAEGTGYPDSEVYNRIHHFPWPDHHPPPFAIVPNLMAAMRNWLLPEKEEGGIEAENKRVAVVHCKAGKGRSGTVACSYLISQEGWKREDALQRFTSRRMRNGFGHGVSIPSQLRWVGYVDRWTNEMDKKYVERPVEVVEVHVQGLRNGVKVCIEGFVDDGRRIQNFHTYTRGDKSIINQIGPEKIKTGHEDDETLISPVDNGLITSNDHVNDVSEADVQDVILKTVQPIRLQTSDLNVDFERRNKVKYTGYAYVTSIAHVWINTWFEGGYRGDDSGVFEIDWEAMDGIKGSARKGVKAFDKMKVVWKYIDEASPQPIKEPGKGEPVLEGKAANWEGDDTGAEAEARHSDGLDSSRSGGALITMGAMINQGASTLSKQLGLRKEDPKSADVSRANTIKDSGSPVSASRRLSEELRKAEEEQSTGFRQHGHEGSSPEATDYATNHEEREGRADTAVGRNFEAGLDKAAHVISKARGNEDESKNDHST